MQSTINSHMLNNNRKLVLFFIFTIIFFSCKDSPTENNFPPDPKPDSTSHNIIWELDTIGNFQTGLHAAWGISTENFWVVGLMYLDTIFGSNMAHWNGSEWKYQNILEGDLFDIIGFSENNIIAVGEWYGAPTASGSGSYIAQWNGSKWNITKLNFEGLRAVWGTSPNNIYAAGHYGTVLRYNGSSWSKMYLISKLYFSDIWGTSNSDIYVSGGDSKGVGALFHFNGSSWRKIYERTYTPHVPSAYTSTIWGYDDTYYLNSGTGQFTGNDTSWHFVDAPTDNTYLEKIRGDSKNNIFFVGHFGLIVHWNGKSWHRYDEFFRKPGGDILQSCWVKEDNVVILGRSETGARGIVYKGKMVF